MRLSATVTGLVLFGVLLLVLWPWLLGNPPDRRIDTRPGGPTAAQQARLLKEKQVRYLTRSAIYISLLMVTFFSATVCAWLLVRQARREYALRTAENLRELIEGTLKDHGKRKG